MHVKLKTCQINYFNFPKDVGKKISSSQKHNILSKVEGFASYCVKSFALEENLFGNFTSGSKFLIYIALHICFKSHYTFALNHTTHLIQIEHSASDN